MHATGNHASVVRFADHLFNLPPLATLRDGRQDPVPQSDAPDDAIMPGVTDLTEAFDPARLVGRAPPLPPSYAEISDDIVAKLPQESGYGRKEIGVVPVDIARSIPNEIPADFNPRPKTVPTGSKP